MAELKTISTAEEFEMLYKGSAYTVTGAGGPLEDWMIQITKALEEGEIGTPKEFYTFKGKQMNENYSLSGNTAYKDDITFLSFPLDNLDVGKLAMFKIRMQDRWFDDIVDNNARHMEEE